MSTTTTPPPAEAAEDPRPIADLRAELAAARKRLQEREEAEMAAEMAEQNRARDARMAEVIGLRDAARAEDAAAAAELGPLLAALQEVLRSGYAARARAAAAETERAQLAAAHSVPAGGGAFIVRREEFLSPTSEAVSFDDVLTRVARAAGIETR